MVAMAFWDFMIMGCKSRINMANLIRIMLFRYRHYLF